MEESLGMQQQERSMFQFIRHPPISRKGWEKTKDMNIPEQEIPPEQH